VHSLIFMFLGSGRFMPMRTFLFMTAYFPVLAYSYSAGFVRGFRRRKEKGCQLNLHAWEHVT